jgi:hypothetical protein
VANVILFTDRAPRKWHFKEQNYYSNFYVYPAGAYKIASVLRAKGYTVLVVPNSLNLSFKCIKRVIKNNSKDLLWVGISTTFMMLRSNNFQEYRQAWHSTDEDFIDINSLFTINTIWRESNELIWSSNEINSLADYCKEEFQCPVLIGGSWVSNIKDGNLKNLKNNVHIITGFAEQVVADFTDQYSKDKSVEPPYVHNNENYNNHDFKSSSIIWAPEDFVTPNTWLPLEVARGCAFNCAYCNYDRRSNFDSFKNPEILREELIRNYELYGTTSYMLVDDLYNDSKEKVRVLYDKVWSKLPFNPEWSSYMRLDMLWADPESADFIRASGARIGSFGIETLHDIAGRRVGKGLGKTRILETLTRLKEVWNDEVLVTAYFLAGLPFEPLDSIKSTMQWTLETDLLFTASWNPLWITPPEHFKIIEEDKLHAISKDNEKFKITWPEPDVWENDQGVRFDQLDILVKEVMDKIPTKFTYAEYADLRTAGVTHYDIVNIKKDKKNLELIENNLHHVQTLTLERLKKIINLSDI